MQLFGKLEELLHIIFSKNGKTIKLQPTASTVDENQTFSLPDLGTTDAHILVTESLGQSLSNKTIGTTNTITGAKAASFSNVAGDATITLPTATDTLVGRATSDTLSNKTIDGDDNTVRDLVLSSFKTAAPNAYKLLQRNSSGVVEEAGTAATLIPSGTTAERPTASEAMTRYNSTIKLIEFYNGTMWKQLSSQSQLVNVATSGAPFTSIQSAIDSISDASSTKPYVVHIAPGIYTETVTLKDWVFLENGIPGGVKIVGRIIATGLTGNSGLKGCTIEYTPTTDSQIVISQSGGGFYLLDADIFLVGTADFIATGVSLSCTTGASIFNSTVYDRRSGNITKAFVGWSFAGTGVYAIFNTSTSARASYTGGTHELFSISGTGSFTMSGGAAIFGNTGAFGSGVVRGFSVTSVSTSPRITTNLQIRLAATSGGTASAFRINSSGGDFQHVGAAVSISGFTANQEYITDTASGATQKLWSCATNKYLTKTGSGTAIVTPLDDAKSGFLEFATNPAEGSTTFWSWSSPNLTVSLAGSGIVRGAPVAWAAGQSVALTDLATNYIYMNSDGVIGATTTANETLFANNIVLLEAWRDGTTLIVSKENHPYKFDTAVSYAWHRLFGVLLEGTGTTLGILSSSARTLTISGTDVLTDHGLDTAIPADTGPLSVTYVWVNNGTGKARFYSTATAIPDQIDTGSTTASITNNKYVVFRFYVTKNNLNATTPQYFSVLPTTEYTSLANAQAAISNGTIQTLPPEIAALESAQIAYVICFKNPGGTFSINSVIVEKQTFTARFLGSSPASSAGLVTTDTSNFNGILSGADVNVQSALDTLDDNAVKAGTGTFTATGLARYVNTTGKVLANPATTPVTMSDTGVLTVNNTTASSSKDTGALIVEGGVGVEEDVYAGGQVVAPTVSGTTSVTTPKLAPISANTVIDVDTNAAINLPIGTTAQRPGTPAQGDFRFNSDEQKLEVYTSSGWTAAGAGGTVIKVAQTGIGTGTFVGQSLYLAVSTWTLANHTTDTTAEVVGLISKITDSGNIEVTLGGEVSPIAYASVFETTPADGDVVWLGTTTGKLTTTKPTTVGYVAKPLGVVRYKDAAGVGGSGYCSVLFNNQRGDTVGGTNLYTTIGLANNATTSFHTIQGAAGTGGWISGTISIDGTTDYVIPFFCHFSRQLDGSTYNVAPQYGSTIPSGLSITNSGSSIQVVMPDVGSPGTCSVTCCVQAAANGTTLPVSVSASAVLGSTSGVAPAAGVIGEYKEAVGSATSQSNGTFGDGGSAGVLLSAGVWDVQGIVNAVPDTGVTLTTIYASLGSGSGNSGTGVDYTRNSTRFGAISITAGNLIQLATPIFRVVISGADVRWYPKSYVGLSGGAATAQVNSTITARRVG